LEDFIIDLGKLSLIWKVPWGSCLNEIESSLIDFEGSIIDLEDSIIDLGSSLIWKHFKISKHYIWFKFYL